MIIEKATVSFCVNSLREKGPVWQSSLNKRLQHIVTSTKLVHESRCSMNKCSDTNCKFDSDFLPILGVYQHFLACFVELSHKINHSDVLSSTIMS